MISECIIRNHIERISKKRIRNKQVILSNYRFPKMVIAGKKIAIICFLCLHFITNLGYCSKKHKFRCKSRAAHSNADYRSRQYTSRIVDGEPLSIGAAGYNVWISANDIFCTGSIIGRKWILTAAHCYTEPDTLEVYVGTDIMMGGEVFNVRKIHKHPKHYMVGMMPYYDYMLLELDRALTYSKSVHPIELATDNNIIQGVLGTVSGFGFTSENDEISNYGLRSVQLPIIEYEECLQYYNATIIPNEGVFCAGFEEGGKSICEGDSGGPFVVGGKLVGISSATDGCGKPMLPTIMSSVYFARPWICRIAGI